MTKNTKLIIFIILLGISGIITVFAAGQMFLVFPRPEIVFVGALCSFLVLALGFYLGYQKKPKQDKKTFEKKK